MTLEQRLAELRERENELKQFSDYLQRRSLFLSWLGQTDKCIRKSCLQDPYYAALGEEWLNKAKGLLDGLPLEECKGKVKVKGAKPMVKKQRLKWKAEHKPEIRAYRNDLQRRNEERQRQNGKKSK